MKTKKNPSKTKNEAQNKPVNPIEANVRKLIEEKFFEVVLRDKQVPITAKTMLQDFVPKKDKAWTSYYVDMYCERVSSFLNPIIGTSLSIRNLKNKPLSEIIDYILKTKMKCSRYK